ncbi:hypothetical protein ACHABQ_02970 [Nesterenkonia aurantiaca]|uniref:DUF7341 domain-containing protein n=1 Tax=Nesterenkonia aurantiaca TaxID=1436010 RepID=UPI003EE666E4
MSLNDNIHQLINPHPLTRPDGTMARDIRGQLIYQPALLDQLATAIHTKGRDGAATSEPGVPINTRAIDLWRELDTDARNEEHERTGSMTGTLGSIIERWTREPRENHQDHLEHVTLDMADRIKNLLEPAPRRRKLRQPCPSCGEHWTLNGEGDREPCLTAGTHDPDGLLRHPHDYDVTCAACGAQWSGEALSDVVHGISAPQRDAMDMAG